MYTYDAGLIELPAVQISELGVEVRVAIFSNRENR
jgi:hypothetical protein